MDNDARLIFAEDARMLLDNRVFKAAIAEINANLDAAIAQAKTTDPIECADVVRAKQILIGLQRTIERYVEDGKVVAKILNLQKSSPVKRVIQR